MSFCILLSAVYALSQVKVIQVGSSVKFTCDTTDVADLEWDFSPTSYPSKSRIVYEYPNVADRFKWRHSVSGNNLSINNVQLCDAGNYKCIFPIGDNLGTDNFQLTVFGKWFHVSFCCILSPINGTCCQDNFLNSTLFANSVCCSLTPKKQQN